jgi:hypothetical protein
VIRITLVRPQPQFPLRGRDHSSLDDWLLFSIRRRAFPNRSRHSQSHGVRGGWSWYGLHLTGVTSSGVPFLELIQPVAVRRHGHWIIYGLPRPSVTYRLTSSSKGALSVDFQL